MAATTIDIRELASRFAEVITAAAGQEVIVTEGNVPRAKLVPLPPQKSRILGLHPGAMQTTNDFDAPLPDDFWAGGE